MRIDQFYWTKCNISVLQTTNIQFICHKGIAVAIRSKYLVHMRGVRSHSLRWTKNTTFYRK